MQRASFSCIDRFANEGDAYTLIPTYRKMVVPGETVDLDATVKFQSAAFTKNLISSALFEHWFFYVPHRLVWDDWVSFIAQDDDYAGTFPTTATDWAQVFDKNGTHSALYRRSFKLIYNEYFGESENANAWYSDITTDTDVSEKFLKNTDQTLGTFRRDNAVEEPTYSVAAPIPLNDFFRQMQAARSRRRAQVSGDKYVDAHLRMGVDLSWMLQQAPERLGYVQQDVYPVKTFDTSSANLGKSRARFEGTVQQSVKKKAFAEHGYIVGVAALRPHVFNTEADHPFDGEATTIDQFYLADNLKDFETHDLSIFSGSVAGSDGYFPRLHWLHKGQHVRGKPTEWVVSEGFATGQVAQYPNGGSLPIGDELGTEDLAVSAKVTLRGRLPSALLTA